MDYRSQPRSWAKRIFLSGESDDERRGSPALARPRVHILAHGAIRAHMYADTCLRSRCAGDALSTNTAATTIIIAAIAAVSTAAVPLLVAALVPLRSVL